MKPCVILKPGKEKAIRNQHHWIFSGAIASSPKSMEGELLPVYTHENELLGSGYFNSQSSIIGRMVSFDATPPLEAIRKNMQAALLLRKELFVKEKSDSYRLINGEGDFLPGLIVDQYGKVLVMQIATLGMERIKQELIEGLVNELQPSAIYEKSTAPTRKEEGLPPCERFCFGSSPDQIQIEENGLRFLLSLSEGQKTGFFLDHREMRQWVRQLAGGKRVLNSFCYTGAFSVYALAGGAVHVDSVDVSEKAISLAQQNIALNGFSDDRAGFHVKDVFEYLRSHEMNYNLVILDPPAFAKRQKDLIQACRGYKDINRLAMQKMPKRSLLLTSSCSYYVDEPLFQKVLFQAAREADRKVRILGKHRLAADHPINICHPEGDYLKSFLLYIE